MSPVSAVRVLVLVALFAFGGSVARADYVTGLNPAGDNFLALRTGPGTSYRMIRRMGPDTIVTVLQRHGEWLLVELEDGTQGWAFGQYIEPGLPPGYQDGSEEGGLIEEDGEPGEDEEFGDEDLVEVDGAGEEEAISEEATEEEQPAEEEEVTDVVSEQWTPYANDRFGTSIEYPAGLFKALPPPDNDDGRSFAARQGDGGFSIFGSNNVFGMTLDELMADDEAGGGYDSVTFRRKGDDWYVLSGYRGGLVFYRKVMLGDGGEVIHTFEITYPRAQKTAFDPVAARMAKSMDTGGTATAGEEETGLSRPAPEDEEVAEEEGGEVPLVSQQVLFDGELGNNWVAHAASGGDFDRDARLAGGVLLVNVPAESGWGNAGILSPNGLVWLDDFGPNAESTVTFTFDPKRTTGFVVSLAVPGYGGVRGNPPGAPNVTFAWSRAADGASGEARFYLSSSDPFKTLQLPAAAPAEVKIIVRPYEVAWTIDGGEEIVGAFPQARPGIGLHVYAYSHTPDWNAPVSMALKSITLDQVRDPATEAMKIVEQGVIFDGTESPGWEAISVEGGDLAKWGRYRGGHLVVNIPEGNWWAQTGLVSTTPVLRMAQFSEQAPYTLRLKLDPDRTDGFAFGLGGEPVHDWWAYHHAYVTILSDADGQLMLTAMDSPYYTTWSRPVPEKWTGELLITLSQEGALASIPDGPSIFVPRQVNEGMDLYIGLSSRPLEAGKPSRFALDSVTWERVVPADLPEDELWFYMTPEQFEPETFLTDLQADLLEDTFAGPTGEEGVAP